MMMEPIRLTVTARDGRERSGWPLTRGVTLPEGAVARPESWRWRAPGARRCRCSSGPLARWPDGSLKVGAGRLPGPRSRAASHRSTAFRPAKAPRPPRTRRWRSPRRRRPSSSAQALCGSPSPSRVPGSSTGSNSGAASTASSSRRRTSRGRAGASCGPGSARASSSAAPGGGSTAWAASAWPAWLRRSGPWRWRRPAPCGRSSPAGGHWNSGRRCTTTPATGRCASVVRIHAYAGQPFVRLQHTVVFTLNPRETQVAEIGLRLPLPDGGEGSPLPVGVGAASNRDPAARRRSAPGPAGGQPLPPARDGRRRAGQRGGTDRGLGHGGERHRRPGRGHAPHGRAASNRAASLRPRHRRHALAPP